MILHYLIKCLKLMIHQILENDLHTIEKWAHQWKMVFNPDITKQAVEIIFSAKKEKLNHPSRF